MTTTTITGSATITAPFFLVDVAAILPGAFILGDDGSVLGGPDVLGDAPDTLAQVMNVTDVGTDPIRRPTAIISSLGIAIAPSTGMLQAIAGMAFCNGAGATAKIHLQTWGGTPIILTLTYGGRTAVNVQYGTA